MYIKKSLGLGLVIGLLAMAFAALPALASASVPEITSPAGTTTPTKTTITATSTNAVTTFAGGAGTLKCEKVVVNGIVTANTGTRVHIEMDGEKDTATNCTLAGIALTVKPTFTTLELTPTEKYALFDFTTSTGLTESSRSTVTCAAGGVTKIHIEGPVTGTNAGTFSGDFTAVTSGGNTVTWDC